MTIEQSPEDSVADRIAAQFDDVSAQPQDEQQPEVKAETDTEVESQAEPEVVEVEFGGKSYQVPPELKDALMAQSDYTKKTSEIAEKARLVELEQQQIKSAKLEREFHKTVSDDILQAQRLDFQIEQYKSVDVTGMNSDQLWQLQRHLDKLKDDRQKLDGTIREKYGKYEQDQLALARETHAKAQEIASKAVPNWSPETQKQISDFAVSQGFRADEVSSITDPRIVKILWAASQFNKLQAQKITGKVTNAPAVKPGSSNPMPQGVKDKFAFNKAMKSANGSNAKAKVIEAELMKRFN